MENTVCSVSLATRAPSFAANFSTEPVDVKETVSNQIRRLPSGGDQQRQILPTKLEGTILLDQRITSPREHPKQQTRLRSRVAPERNGSKPGPFQLITPPLHLNLARPLGPAHGHDVLDLAAQ
ncbi:hypothetical protein CR513_20289, partial [Mucuna pruriens]